jgi:hypothetical protein
MAQAAQTASAEQVGNKDLPFIRAASPSNSHLDPHPLAAAPQDYNKPVPGEKKTRLPRSTGVRGSRARCSFIEKRDRVPVFFSRLERAYSTLRASPPPSPPC